MIRFGDFHVIFKVILTFVDLQAQIHNKDYQLQLINSISIILRDKVRYDIF